MPKFSLVLLIALLILFSSSYGEVIDGPANFRIKPKGGVLVALNDGITVNCFKQEHGWFKITFIIKINKQQFDRINREYSKGYAVRKGEKLFDLQDKFVGVALADVPDTLTNVESYGGVRSPISYQMEFFGYVARNNIKINSIPENILDSVFIKKAQHLNLDTLKNFMMEQGYKDQGMINRVLPNFHEYCIYESEDNSAGYRIGLIFENNNLIAIEHSRALNIPHIKESQLAHGNAISFVKTPKSLSPVFLIKKIDEIFRGAD